MANETERGACQLLCNVFQSCRAEKVGDVRTSLLRDLVEKYLHACVGIGGCGEEGLSNREFCGARAECMEDALLAVNFWRGGVWGGVVRLKLAHEVTSQEPSTFLRVGT